MGGGVLPTTSCGVEVQNPHLASVVTKEHMPSDLCDRIGIPALPDPSTDTISWSALFCTWPLLATEVLTWWTCHFFTTGRVLTFLSTSHDATEWRESVWTLFLADIKESQLQYSPFSDPSLGRDGNTSLVQTKLEVQLSNENNTVQRRDGSIAVSVTSGFPILLAV